MILKALHGTYHQKSRTFLYPLLGIRYTSNIKPKGTYVSWYGRIAKTDRKLLVVYNVSDTPGYKAFESSVLFTNPFFEAFYELEDNQMVYVFNLTKYAQDWDYFIAGKYSKLSLDVKTKIKNYFGEGNQTWGYVESYLYPPKYFEQYTELLADKLDQPQMLEQLKQVGELSNKPDFMKEKLMLLEKGTQILDDLSPLETTETNDND